MMHTRVYRGEGDGTIAHDLAVANLEAAMTHPDARIWFDLTEPTPEELHLLEHDLGILPLTTEDLAHQGQRAKLEEFEGYAYLVAFDLKFHNGLLETNEIDILLGERFLVTSHRGSFGPIADSHHLAQRLPQIMAKGVDYLLYALLDDLVDSYFPALEAFDDAVDELEDAIVADPTPEVLTRIFAMKRNVVQLRKVTNPQLEMFNRLMSETFALIQPSHIVYFRDVHDHLIRVFEVIEAYRDQMTSALDAYLSMTSNRMNDVMKRLTVVAAIFLPITFLTGVFGMNFGAQPWVQQDPGWLFWAALVVMLAITAGQIMFYRKKRWL